MSTSAVIPVKANPEVFEIPGFRLALAVASLAGMTLALYRELQGHHTSDILLFIDSDVAVPADIISKITAIFSGEPHLTAVIGSYDDEPAAANFLSQYKNLVHHYIHQNSCAEGFTFWGACGAVRREIFFALEGFDEGYRQPSIEDIELGYRLRRAGHKIRLAKEIQVTHLKRWETLSLLKSDFLHRALPWTELAWRDRHLPDDLNLRLSSRLSALLACALATALMAAFWSRKALGIAALLALLLLGINASLYRFFPQARREICPRSDSLALVLFSI